MDIKEFFEKHDRVAVAFSGGVDSSVLLALAKKYAKRVKAYCVKSAFQPQFELNDALEISKLLNAETEIINADILSNPAVTDNPENRCYFCKRAIFGEIIKHAEKDGFKAVIEGTNATDDLSDRPGYKALQELGVLSPLLECGYTKSDIRKAAAEFSLPVADKPSYACLATRIPHGTIITAELLNKTEAAEGALMKMGFKNFRVRFNNNSAKLEFGRADLKLFNENRDAVFAALSPYYDKVYSDPKVRNDE